MDLRPCCLQLCPGSHPQLMQGLTLGAGEDQDVVLAGFRVPVLVLLVLGGVLVGEGFLRGVEHQQGQLLSAGDADAGRGQTQPGAKGSEVMGHSGHRHNVCR